MSKNIVILAGKSGQTHKHILFRYGEHRKWRYIENWKFNRVAIILPFFRFRRGYREFQIGLGNHYFDIGY